VQAPKVKLGDKITALQQIVSPFGKVTTHFALTLSFFRFLFFMNIYNQQCSTFLTTYFIIMIIFFVEFQTDTASVLFEAIGYIKFLQEQVQVGIIMQNFLSIALCGYIIHYNCCCCFLSSSSSYHF